MATALDYETRRNELKVQRDKEFIEFLKSQNDLTFSEDLESYRESKSRERERSIASLKLGKSKSYKPRVQRPYRPRLVVSEELSPVRKSSRIRKRKRVDMEETSDCDDEEVLLELDQNWRFNPPPKRVKQALRYSELGPRPSIHLVTAAMLANVHRPGIPKRYSSTGTSCHQCRQKTADQKTICRSGRCVGGRGMLCQICLHNRYGEDIRDVLVNPIWECPCCKGECNQSNCLRRLGLRPTGCLYPNIGPYSSVRDFLKGERLFPLPRPDLPADEEDKTADQDDKTADKDDKTGDKDKTADKNDKTGDKDEEEFGDTDEEEFGDTDDEGSGDIEVEPHEDAVKKEPVSIWITPYELEYTDDEDDFLGW